MRIPSLSRRTEPARDDTAVRDDTDGPGTHRGAADGRDGDADRRAADRAAAARAATRSGREAPGTRTAADPATERTLDGRTTDLDRDGTATRADRDDTATRADRDGDGVPDRAERPVVAGPKPRASLLATIGLITAVAGLLFVLTGALAGYGIGLGTAGAVLAVLGLMATRRRHVAGTTDALLGIVAGLGAVVLGVLAMTGQFDWPTTDGDWVTRFREWLDSQFVDRF
ncbi:thrombospondin [Micromonospora sp. NPDC126480]|uniref:thrombospondin n=1 Tax=Micromonospora sp. NPDC126480 TaxID=3155312 RepID=UPI0033221BB9